MIKRAILCSIKPKLDSPSFKFFTGFRFIQLLWMAAICFPDFVLDIMGLIL